MQGILYEERSAWLFLLVTVVLGGWTAWMTGRSLAATWRPVWSVALWGVPLTFAVRFIHFALFGGTLLSARYGFVDYLVVLAFVAVSFRVRRTRQMTTQYRWLYERTGPLTWRERPQV